MKRLFKHFHRKPLKEDFIIVTGERDDARKRKAKREKTIKHIGS